MTFDVANACLAFINGMDIAARMIERGDIDYALVVDGETANLVYEKTLERMTAPDVTADAVPQRAGRADHRFGAAAMVMARSELVPDAPRYKGGVTRSATEWNQLCLGNLDRMVTDTRLLLIEGIKLAQKTFTAARRPWAGPWKSWTSS
jgi:3-oxoacyl-[acyl-carrier-protein] synthase-3